MQGFEPMTKVSSSDSEFSTLTPNFFLRQLFLARRLQVKKNQIGKRHLFLYFTIVK